MKNIETGCFHSLWKLACFFLFFIAELSSSQIYVKDSTVIFYVKDSIVLDTHKAKIYLAKGTAFINLSESKNYEITYIDYQETELKNYNSLANKNVRKNIKTAKAIKTSRINTDIDRYLEFIANSKQSLFNRQASEISCWIFANNSSSKYKVGLSTGFYFDLFFQSSETVNIIGLTQIKKISYSEFFFTRPPPSIYT